MWSQRMPTYLIGKSFGNYDKKKKGLKLSNAWIYNSFHIKLEPKKKTNKTNFQLQKRSKKNILRT